MGGADWNAMEVVFELLGVEDPHRMIVLLAALRDWKRENPAD